MPIDEPHPPHPIREPLDSDAPLSPFRWRVNLALFLATVVSVLLTGALYRGTLELESLSDLVTKLPLVLTKLPSGWPFAVPLLAILLTHEFGHYIAARIHRVDASLPFFLPLPLLSPFGTMGAVIAMRGRIRSRAALLDIGASGPLAGLVIAIPVLVVGLAHSQVMPLPPHGEQEGQSLLYLALKRLVLGPIPDGYDVFLSPVAFAGWTGLFITALNLIPVAQLDGGHVAYALFGARQNRYSRWIHAGMLGMFALNLALNLRAELALGGLAGEGWKRALGNSTFWLMWYGLLHLVMRTSGRDHPETEPSPLGPGRRAIAVVTLALFVLLFMPMPWTRR